MTDNPGTHLPSLEYIRKAYRVPAFVGRRVHYMGSGPCHDRRGEIVGADNNHLVVRFDGIAGDRLLHPTWKLEYLPWRPPYLEA